MFSKYWECGWLLVSLKTCVKGWRSSNDDLKSNESFPQPESTGFDFWSILGVRPITVSLKHQTDIKERICLLEESNKSVGNQAMEVLILLPPHYILFDVEVLFLSCLLKVLAWLVPSWQHPASDCQWEQAGWGSESKEGMSGCILVYILWDV